MIFPAWRTSANICCLWYGLVVLSATRVDRLDRAPNNFPKRTIIRRFVCLTDLLTKSLTDFSYNST